MDTWPPNNFERKGNQGKGVGSIDRNFFCSQLSTSRIAPHRRHDVGFELRSFNGGGRVISIIQTTWVIERLLKASSYLITISQCHFVL